MLYNVSHLKSIVLLDRNNATLREKVVLTRENWLSIDYIAREVLIFGAGSWKCFFFIFNSSFFHLCTSYIFVRDEITKVLGFEKRERNKFSRRTCVLHVAYLICISIYCISFVYLIVYLYIVYLISSEITRRSLKFLMKSLDKIKKRGIKFESHDCDLKSNSNNSLG